MSLCGQGLALAGRLGGVSIDLRPGEVTAICGPNGAGKSSLLTVLAGLVVPDAGEVRLDGLALSAMGARVRARSLGYLPQAGDVAWDMDVSALVALGRLPWGDGAAVAGRGAVGAALGAMDLADLAGRRISTLSGGERARAMLARVLAGEPDWLLADEPLAHLDVRHALALMAALRAQARQGRGVVVVMHDLAMAMNHADRVVVMGDGAVVADGPPAQALGADVLRQVWGVEAQWLGEAGGWALALVAGDLRPQP